MSFSSTIQLKNTHYNIMGMFDTITVEFDGLPLPKEMKVPMPSRSFQTKDLECYLFEYKIDQNKQLLLFSPKTKQWEPTNITNTVEFYNYYESDNYDYSIDYKATFYNGVLTSIDLIKYESSSNAERKQRLAKVMDNLKKRNEFERTFLYRHIYGKYNWVIKRVFNFMRKINKIDFYKWERKFEI